MSTVAAVIIGDELLAGRFADENGPWLVQRLRALGARLVRMTTVGDDPAAIEDAVSRSLAVADAVITSGGIGPTHDDNTLAAVAAALARPLVIHEGLLERLATWGAGDDAANRRMASLPFGTEIVTTPRGFPVFVADRVVVLPGVPRLFRTGFDAVASRFAGPPAAEVWVVTSRSEGAFATALAEWVLVHPEIDVGSYPRLDEVPAVVRLSVTGKDAARVACLAFALATLVGGAVEPKA